MNTEFLLTHLKEAQEELDSIINTLKNNSKHPEVSFEIEIQHLYHHLNTAWNGRNSLANEEETDEIFYKRRQFPTDIDMTRHEE